MRLAWHPPSSVAQLAGYAGAAFLIGIAWHSLAPYQHLAAWIVPILTALGVLLALQPLRSFIRRVTSPLLEENIKRWTRLTSICLLAFTIGLWRFDASIARLPKNLIPLSPKGLAYISTDVPVTEFARARSFLDRRASEFFPPDQAALLTGILYGNHRLPKDVKDDFRRAGLLHIVAVSGSNVTIVVVLVMPVLLALRLSRRVAFSVLTVALIAFVLFVAPGASVIRAAIMGWLIELAPLVGRVPRPSRLLLVSAVAFTLWTPWALLFDASFALSFLAMWGLLTWGQWITDSLNFLSWKMPVQIFAASLGASMMTMPYTMWAFGQLSLWGLVTGLLALPLVPWITVLGIMTLVVPSFLPVRLATQGFLSLLLWIGKVPGTFHVGYWSQLSTPVSFLLACYAFFYLIWLSVQPKKELIHKKTVFSPWKAQKTE